MMGDKKQNSLMDIIQYDRNGLIPVIAQCVDSHEILMMAWMNQEALEETVRTGRVCYWSRSRQSLWRKGESSGQVQQLQELRVDCDGDTLLALVKQEGVACHTGHKNCFYFTVADDLTLSENQPVVTDPDILYRDKRSD